MVGLTVMPVCNTSKYAGTYVKPLSLGRHTQKKQSNKKLNHARNGDEYYKQHRPGLLAGGVVDDVLKSGITPVRSVPSPLLLDYAKTLKLAISCGRPGPLPERRVICQYL